MKRTGLTTRYWLATLALTTLIWVAPGRAQSPSTTPQNPSTQNSTQNNDDLVRWQLANFDQFLDSHPEVSEQLRKNPSLVDDQQFVENHPALQQYLHEHPAIRADIEQNPRAVMHQEQQYERTEDRGRDRPDITRGELARMDQFLDKHPEIAEQLKKDPKLIDDQKWVDSHPELQQFMKSHPEVRQQFDEHPYAFMRDEDRYDRWEDRPGKDRPGEDHHDGETDRGQLSSFHNFLEGHRTIAAEISQNPTLATNDEYLQNHTELQAYLQANPEIKQQLNQNPQSFVKSAQGTGMTTPGTAPKTTTVPKMPGADPKSN